MRRPAIDAMRPYSSEQLSSALSNKVRDTFPTADLHGFDFGFENRGLSLLWLQAV